MSVKELSREMKLLLMCLLGTVTWSYLVPQSRPRNPITKTVLFAETEESDLPPSNDFDIEKVLNQIAVEKDQKRAADAQQALDEKRAVLQKRSDKNYEKYWVDKEKKELAKESKDLATLRSYYSGGPNRSNSSLSKDNAESGWDYQAVPVNPSQGDGITASVSFGVALLATALIVGKKILSPAEADSKKNSKKKVKPVRGAINMPGIGIVNVD